MLRYRTSIGTNQPTLKSQRFLATLIGSLVKLKDVSLYQKDLNSKLVNSMDSVNSSSMTQPTTNAMEPVFSMMLMLTLLAQTKLFAETVDRKRWDGQTLLQMR